MKRWAIVLALVLAGCNASHDKAETDALKAKIERTESRLAAAEQRINQLEDGFKQTGNWVLWKRVQYTCPACLYNVPRPISAYPTRGACVVAATRLIEPGGNTISTDPIELEYTGKRLYFHCLPPGVDAGK